MNDTILNKESIKYGTYIEMYLLHCCNCGIPFSIPDDLDNRLRKSHDTFYCPNGHAQSYTDKAKTKEEIELKNKIAELDRRLKESQSNEKFWLERWQQNMDEKNKLKKEMKQMKTRAKNGVCPCCNRSFANLHNHMKTKHPEFK